MKSYIVKVVFPKFDSTISSSSFTSKKKLKEAQRLERESNQKLYLKQVTSTIQDLGAKNPVVLPGSVAFSIDTSKLEEIHEWASVQGHEVFEHENINLAD